MKRRLSVKANKWKEWRGSTLSVGIFFSLSRKIIKKILSLVFIFYFLAHSISLRLPQLLTLFCLVVLTTLHFHERLVYLWLFFFVRTFREVMLHGLWPFSYFVLSGEWWESKERKGFSFFYYYYFGRGRGILQAATCAPIAGHRRRLLSSCAALYGQEGRRRADWRRCFPRCWCIYLFLFFLFLKSCIFTPGRGGKE